MIYGAINEKGEVYYIIPILKRCLILLAIGK